MLSLTSWLRYTDTCTVCSNSALKSPCCRLMLHVCVNLVTGYLARGKLTLLSCWGVSVVVFVCLFLNSDMELQWMLGGGWARRGEETSLLNTVILCNSGSHLQNWILINTSFIVCFSCFCQYRGGDYSTFIHLWPVSDCLLQKQNTLLKVFFHFAVYNAWDCCWVKPEVLSPWYGLSFSVLISPF